MIFNVDGKEVFASNGGSEHRLSQKTLVMIHGSGMNHEIWAGQSSAFANRGVNVISLDLPGHGLSQGSALDSIDQIADWLERFLNATKLESVSVLGHSMGALVAIQFASTYPNRCDGAILAGVAGRMAVNPDLLRYAKQRDPLAFDLLTKWSHRNLNQRAIAASRRMLESEDAENLFTDLNACNEYLAAPERVSNLLVPLTIIAASNDKMTPADGAQVLADRLNRATTVYIDNAGHNMMLEEADKFNVAVVRALFDQDEN